MKLLKHILILASLSFSTAILASAAEDSITKAEEARVKVAKAGYEWTTTSLLINEAKQAAADGNQELAIKLANEAIKQTEEGMKQADFADKNWQDTVPE